MSWSPHLKWRSCQCSHRSPLTWTSSVCLVGDTMTLSVGRVGATFYLVKHVHTFQRSASQSISFTTSIVFFTTDKAGAQYYEVKDVVSLHPPYCYCSLFPEKFKRHVLLMLINLSFPIMSAYCSKEAPRVLNESFPGLQDSARKCGREASHSHSALCHNVCGGLEFWHCRIFGTFPWLRDSAEPANDADRLQGPIRQRLAFIQWRWWRWPTRIDVTVSDWYYWRDMMSGVSQYHISSYHSPIFLTTTTSYVKSARCINVVPLTLFSTSTWLTCFDVYNIHSAEACRAMPHPSAWNKTRPSFIHSFIALRSSYHTLTHTCDGVLEVLATSFITVLSFKMFHPVNS